MPKAMPETGRDPEEILREMATLKAAGVTAILTSETRRATLTAEPLARALAAVESGRFSDLLRVDTTVAAERPVAATACPAS